MTNDTNNYNLTPPRKGIPAWGIVLISLGSALLLLLVIVAVILFSAAVSAGNRRDSAPAPVASASPYEAPTPSVTPTPTPEPLSADKAYLETVYQAYPELAGQTDSDAVVVEFGHASCDTIEAAGSVEAGITLIIEAAEDSGVDLEMAGYLFGAAVPAYCPEYTDELNALVNTYAG